MHVVVSRSVTDTHRLAASILNEIKRKNVICLYGDLGSGKTTFVQGLANALGVKGNVQSPTFTLVREYAVEARSKNQELRWRHLIHVDCYRVDSEKDLKGVSLQECWEDKKNLVVIEWAERVKAILPEKRLEICFEAMSNRTRKITLF